MAVEIGKLIAAINPDVYCSKEETYDEDSGKRIQLNKIVSRIAKEKGYLEAAKKAKPKEGDYIDVMDTRLSNNAFSLSGLKNPIEMHSLVYDASSQSIEQVYFWLIDYINKEYGNTEKLIDNFVSSPSSGHFAEIQGRATRMQEEAMKMLGAVNQIVKSVLNIVYDLKEFKLRLSLYDQLKSKDKEESGSAILSLKQIWLDTVDVKRNTTSIKGMAQQFDYVTLIDAFMSSKSLEDVTRSVEKGGLDLNDRVRRILQQRLPEFQKWVIESERELRKRFEIEKTYLKSQVNTIKLYARWIKPYLNASRKLEQNVTETSDLVNSFNTALFELSILGKADYNPAGDISQGDLPKIFTKLVENRKLGGYYPITIVDLKFRSIPERSDQRGGYSYRGKVDIKFTSYALSEKELKLLKENLTKDDIGEVMQLIEGSSTESLGQLTQDIDEFLKDKKEDGKKEEKANEDDINPFTALFSFAKKDKKTSEDDKIKYPEYEDVLRSQAILESRWKCRKLYDEYKKTHGMSAFPPVQ